MQPNKGSGTSAECEECEECEEDEGAEAEDDVGGELAEIELLEQMIPKLAETIAQMGLTDSEILRVTPAFQAFRQCALALRSYHGDLYSKSEKSTKISTFWSHSWHGKKWRKIITLIVFYNGQAAAVLGMFCAVVMMVLFCFDLLPALNRGSTGEIQFGFSCWSLWSGFFATSLVIIFWQPQSRVFLDRICISQMDHELKTRGIISLAGMLKQSDSMLILWDPTWTERLWCLFELAAFLQSKKDQKKQLLIRPTLSGPLHISFFLVSFAGMIPINMVPMDVSEPILMLANAGGVVLCASVASYVAMSTLRSYFRDLDTMKQQLLRVSFDTSRASCCDDGHRRGGRRTPCDRKILKECVKQWFGSQETFEHTLRSEILEILMRDLAKRVFTTKSTLAMFMPIIWAFMDHAASEERFYPGQFWVKWTGAAMLEGLSIWLLFMPILKDVLVLVGEVTRVRPKSLLMEVIKNSLASMTLLLPLMIVMGTYVGLTFIPALYDFPPLVRSGIFFACMLLYSTLTRCIAAGIRAFSS
mmetsp:Transcript_39514/g.80826  ORF Transcript_39514/g.80826 Transcript_39514/m.80826 type:complete len:530 (+) Transcript_39514:86-1675(+)